MKNLGNLQRLSSEEELEFLKVIYQGSNEKVFCFLRDAFTLLQVRSQMLLGLATICLTITGFSGPRMAASNPFSRVFITLGLTFVLFSVAAVVAGPLRLRWMTAWRADSVDETLLENLRHRDRKTRLYKWATACLLLGLTSYLFSLICFLLTVE